MYTIYVDNEPLYVPTLTDSGYGVFSPRLTVELSRAGSLEFTLPPNNVMYDKIKKMTSVVKVYQDDRELFEGRVLHDEKDFYKQKKVYCEGELAYLLDSIVRRSDVTNPTISFNKTSPRDALKKLIELHNESMASPKSSNKAYPPDKTFTVGTVSVKTDEGKALKVSCEIKDYPTTLDAISSFLDSFGGYVTTRKVGDVRYIDWIKNLPEQDPAVTTSQIIEFGVNMLDITEYITAEDICTKLIPVGEEIDGKKLTIVDINSEYPRDWVCNHTAANLFGIIEKKVDFEGVTSRSVLESRAEKYLKQNMDMSVNLTIRAIDLEGLYVNTNAIHVGDWVQVISLPHELNKPFQCTKIVYDLESPDQNEYSFGVEYDSLTTKQANDKKGASKLSSVIIEEIDEEE